MKETKRSREGRERERKKGGGGRERGLTVFSSAVSMPSTYTTKARSNDIERFKWMKF